MKREQLKDFYLKAKARIKALTVFSVPYSLETGGGTYDNNLFVFSGDTAAPLDDMRTADAPLVISEASRP